MARVTMLNCRMANIDEILAAITAATSKLSEVQPVIATARTDSTEVAGMLAQLNSETPSRHMAEAAVKLGEAVQHLAVTQQVIIEAAAAVRAAKGDSGLQRGDQPARAAPERPEFKPRVFDARRLAPLRRYRDAETAEGVLYLKDGTRHSDEVLRAKRGSSAFPPDRLKDKYKDTTPNDGHIEGNVAAMMWKDETLNGVTLYLNAEPCDNKGKGCKENTHAFMPPDSVMNTWAQNDDGGRVFKRITGTGEAFK